MATYNKYQDFIEQVFNKVHDLFGTQGSASNPADTVKLALTNTAPSAANHKLLADITEISAGNGYSAGGTSLSNSCTRASGTITFSGTTVVFTASGGTIGPFEYVVMYNSTPTTPLKPLISWWDYGSAVTLQDGETFTVAFSGGVFTAS
jgi:hypothetical protein